MGRVETYQPGRFSWIELVTTNPSEAKAFYSSLFGWTKVDLQSSEGSYTVFRQNGEDVAGLYEMTDAQHEHNIPSHWLSYLSVSDVDEATDLAIELGAAMINPPTDVGGTDRVSIVEDPTGAVIGLQRAGGLGGADLVNEPFSFTWSEHITAERKKAEDFYRRLLNCQIVGIEAGNGEARSFLKDRSDRLIASMAQTDSESIASHWQVYFGVKDIQRVLEAIEENNGVVLIEPTKIEGIGQVARGADPQGAVFSIVQLQGENGG